MLNTEFQFRVQQRLPEMTAAERRVGDFVLAQPQVAVGSSITELAEAAESSASTVVRFCRAAGFNGYKELQLAIAAALPIGRTSEKFSMASAELSPNDSAADVVAKIAFQDTQAINMTAQALDLDALNRTVELIRGAGRIDIFGAGSSGLTAQDLSQKLHRFGKTTFCWADSHLSLTSVALTGPGNVAIGISHSGLTTDTYECLELAGSLGADTIALTNWVKSPLASIANVVLASAVTESRYRAGAMSSRMAQMALVDFITLRLLQTDFGRTGALLERTYTALASRRMRPGRTRPRPETLPRHNWGEPKE